MIFRRLHDTPMDPKEDRAELLHKRQEALALMPGPDEGHSGPSQAEALKTSDHWRSLLR
jgi:hypothetical protein